LLVSGLIEIRGPIKVSAGRDPAMRSNGMSKISGEELAVKEIVSPRSIETSAGVAFGKDITGSFERLEAGGGIVQFGKQDFRSTVPITTAQFARIMIAQESAPSSNKRKGDEAEEGF
jgi:hypothetical protein